MMRLKKFRQAKKQQGGEFKIIIVFHSVHDSLFNVDSAQEGCVTKA